MALNYFLRVGDKITCGVKTLTSDSTMSWYGNSVSCGKHSGVYEIIDGVKDAWSK